MKPLYSLLLTLLPLAGISQCIDPSLIDPTVICVDIFDPVCGCDGVTYSNSCEATYHGGVLSFTPGPCAEASLGCLDLNGVDFGPCDLFLGYGYVNGEVVSISGCSTFGSNSFEYDSYIFDTILEAEEACSNVSNCIDPDNFSDDPCILVVDPVCGCDNVTYSNVCFAITLGGVTSWTNGECQGGACLDLSNIDFGDCDLALGFGHVNGQCQSISGCDYIGSNGFDYSENIWNNLEDCQAACSNLEGCIDPDLISDDPCPLAYIPVCGCDGNTYTNLCFALNAGVTSWTEGVCPFECIDETLIDPDGNCPDVYAPVCGCNGITYSNSCYAQILGGVSAWVDGECLDTDNDGSPDVLDCAMFDPQIAPGLPCDDDNPNTINDAYDDCCQCTGELIDEPAGCQSDLNNDGISDVADLLIFLSGFGQICQ